MIVKVKVLMTSILILSRPSNQGLGLDKVPAVLGIADGGVALLKLLVEQSLGLLPGLVIAGTVLSGDSGD